MSFQILSDAWKNASVIDRKKFLKCMENPLKTNLDKNVPLEYALEVLAYSEEKK